VEVYAKPPVQSFRATLPCPNENGEKRPSFLIPLQAGIHYNTPEKTVSMPVLERKIKKYPEKSKALPSV
jgi:hypothetical protein